MHEVVEKQSHDEKLPSVATDAGVDTLEKDTMSKKGIIGSQPTCNHNVFTHDPKDHNCEVCKNKGPVWEKNQEGHGGNCTFYKIRKLDHGRS